MISFSALITCYNRKEKTLSCLRHLYAACDKYNVGHTECLYLQVYLVDDNCTDGTADAVRDLFPGVNILYGTGSLYWAGGMNFAWTEAIKNHNKTDYYFLVNDDTDIFEIAFDEMLLTDKYCRAKYGQQGVYCGITRFTNESKASFGGSVRGGGLLCPIGEPQECDYICANATVVPSSVVDKIGILDSRFIHSAADYDYGLTAKKNGIPVLTTSVFVGKCDNEHHEDSKKWAKIPLKERREKLMSPTTGKRDYLSLVKKHYPKRYLATKFVFLMQIYMPRLYSLIFAGRINKDNQRHNR